MKGISQSQYEKKTSQEVFLFKIIYLYLCKLNKMRTKEEYIVSVIHELEERRNEIMSLPLKEVYMNNSEAIEDAERAKQDYFDLVNSKIAKIKDLSDEEYELIVEFENRYNSFELKLTNAGLTWEDFDNMLEEEQINFVKNGKK